MGFEDDKDDDLDFSDAIMNSSIEYAELFRRLWGGDYGHDDLDELENYD